MPIIECSAVLFDLDGTVLSNSPTFTNYSSSTQLPLSLVFNRLVLRLIIAHWTDFAGENGLDPAVILATSHGFLFPRYVR